MNLTPQQSFLPVVAGDAGSSASQGSSPSSVFLSFLFIFLFLSPEWTLVKSGHVGNRNFREREREKKKE